VDDNVVRFFADVYPPMSFIDNELDVRIFEGEARQGRIDPGAEAEGGGDLQLTGQLGLHFRYCGARTLCFREDFLAMLEQGRAAAGQGEFLGASFQQHGADMLFEPPQPAADGGLGSFQRRGCLVDAAGIDDFIEEQHRVDVDARRSGSGGGGRYRSFHEVSHGYRNSRTFVGGGSLYDY